ncbi:Venom allergen 5.01 [Trichinella britovi]|uniref:Venom allergen 5.01 n=1 Tax=Trichinella britovi TaxID=45882 RepID=A0A0V1CKI3_TRIBR|nr:Venom allergen 5.01 [Trichinella britovi]
MNLIFLFIFSTVLLSTNAISSVSYQYFLNGERVTDQEKIKKLLEKYPHLRPSGSKSTSFQRPLMTSSSDGKSVQESLASTTPAKKVISSKLKIRPPKRVLIRPPAKPENEPTVQNLQKLVASSSTEPPASEGVLFLPNTVKEFITEQHNSFRKQVAKGLVPGQPRASAMNELIWSDAIAENASKWAAGCAFEHTPRGYYCGMLGFSSVGENLAVSTVSPRVDSSSEEALKDAFSRALNGFFIEHKDFRHSDRYCNPGKKCGHYTQMVVDSTLMVGCGIAVCNNGIQGFIPGRRSHLIVCNYIPGNNIKNRPPYETKPKNCPSNRPHRKDDLCTGHGPNYQTCEDSRKSCKTWKEEGKCDLCNNPFQKFMSENCAQTCGYC